VTEPVDPAGPERRSGEDDEARARAAEADDSLAPGSEPGGPEYPEDASEGRESEPPGAPAH
jgi:hypothetical protein